MAGHMWRSLDHPASRERRAAPPPAGKHVNFVKGTNPAMRRGAKGAHAAVNTLRAQKLRVTAPNLAQLQKFQKLPQCTVDFSRLHAELKEYTGPDTASTTGLTPTTWSCRWAAGSSSGRTRRTSTLASRTHTRPWMATQGSRAVDKYRLFAAVITATECNIASVLPSGYIRWVKPPKNFTGKTARFCVTVEDGYIRWIKRLAGTTS